MARLRPIPAACHASPATFINSDLEKCTHIFLHQETTRRALEPPYSSAYQVLSRRVETLQLIVCGRPVTVSTDRVKPVYMLNENGHGITTFNLAVDTIPAVAPPAAPPSPIA
jgi:hypothetical protein